MNAKPFFYILAASSLYLTSCKEELKPQEDSTAIRADDTKNTSTPTPTANTTQTPVQTTQNQTATGNSPAGVNPAHGQPGHQCGIPVGAPLNSAASKTTTQPAVTQTIQPTMNPSVSVAKPAPTAKGMNPPHGQPGHQCGIAVGAPLNSKPQTTTQATQTQNPTVQFTPAPTNNTTSEATTSTPPALLTPPVATAPGMNPPHGQEGHVCGVAVGSPLPKK